MMTPDLAARLNPLLDELAEMGVSQSLSQGLQQRLQELSPPPQPAVPAPSARELTVQERLERLSAEEASRRLQPCALVTVAQLLRSAEWPWKAQVLGMMPEARRAEVLDHMTVSQRPSRLQCLHRCTSGSRSSHHPRS